MLKLMTAAAASFGVVVCSIAAAQAPATGALAACRAAAADAEPDPTAFKCDWKTVVRGAPGAALTGRFALIQKGVSGTMTILEGGGQAMIAISTVEKRSLQTCMVKVEATRGSDDALKATPAEASGCTIRIKSNGRNTVEVASEGCQFYCGARIGFDGTYRLTTR